MRELSCVNECLEPESNRHALRATDFKSGVSTYSTTEAGDDRIYFTLVYLSTQAGHPDDSVVTLIVSCSCLSPSTSETSYP